MRSLFSNRILEDLTVIKGQVIGLSFEYFDLLRVCGGSQFAGDGLCEVGY